jgi:hypothetical protein
MYFLKGVWMLYNERVDTRWANMRVFNKQSALRCIGV